MTTQLLDPLTEPVTDTAPPDDIAHIVWKDDQMRGYLEGIPIVALCGKKWIPSRDYKNLPVCEECKIVYERTVEAIKSWG